MTSALLKPLLLITVVLILPLAALLIWGEAFAAQIERWREHPPHQAALGAAVIAILASDVFLPVPSGPVSALAGSALGPAWGTMTSCLGMTIGAGVAFALARRWGRPLAVRLSSQEQVAQLEVACREHGLWMLAVTRPLPILAEACALLVGALQMSWRRFLPTVIFTNLAISAGYAVLGDRAAAHGWLPLALGIAVAIPLAVAVYWRGRLRRVQ